MQQSAMDLVNEARAMVEGLSCDAVESALKEEDTVLVDLREPHERAEHGVIEGAVHVPRGMLEFHADPSLPYHKPELLPDRRVILHCASGGRSALGAATLKRMGYAKVAHMEGGLKAWKDAGKPTKEA